MPDSASFRIVTIWLSLNFDFRMTTPEPDQSTADCQSTGGAYARFILKRPLLTSALRLGFFSSETRPSAVSCTHVRPDRPRSAPSSVQRQEAIQHAPWRVLHQCERAYHFL